MTAVMQPSSMDAHDEAYTFHNSLSSNAAVIDGGTATAWGALSDGDRSQAYHRRATVSKPASWVQDPVWFWRRVDSTGPDPHASLQEAGRSSEDVQGRRVYVQARCGSTVTVVDAVVIINDRGVACVLPYVRLSSHNHCRASCSWNQHQALQAHSSHVSRHSRSTSGAL